MIHTIFQYTVKAGRTGIVQEAIDNQIAAIKKEFGDAVQLKVYCTADDLSYVHLASFKDDETADRYVNSALLEKFIGILHENSETYSQLKELKYVNSTED